MLSSIFKRKKWFDQNIVVDGKFKGVNVFGFFTNYFVYVLVNNMCFVTMYLTNQAGINVGVITTIWSVFPPIVCSRLSFTTIIGLDYSASLAVVCLSVHRA